MKNKLLILILMIFFSFVAKAQIVNIPNANFKAKLLSSSPSNTIALDFNSNYFAIDANGDGEIQVSEAQQVLVLDVSSSNISSLEGILSFSNLQILRCGNNQLTTINVQGLTELGSLVCNNNQLTSLNVQGLTYLQSLFCENNQLTSLNVQGLTELGNLVCNNNQLTSLNVQGAINLQYLWCYNNQITTLNVQGLTNLQDLYCYNNQLTSLNVQGLIDLEYLWCWNNQLTSLNVQGLTSLYRFDCNNNQLTSLNVQGLTNLETLKCNNNQLTSLSVQGLTDLQYLYCDNNQLTSLNIQGLTNLLTLWCNNNQLTFLNLQSLFPILQQLDCSVNQLTSLDVEGLTNLQFLACNNNQLTSLFIKNGRSEVLNFSGNPNLQYICADDSQLVSVQNNVFQYGYANTCNVNSYCIFIPGGNYNTITGTVRFDENNNGCDTNDEAFEHMKLKINGGTSIGATFTNDIGKYNFYTQTGSFTITAEPENPALFIVTPATFSTSFANNNNNTFTQNICVTPIGSSSDLEVVVAPVTNAVPSFNAKYKLMWRNKGNTTLSGNATFTFDASKMTFVSSSLPYATLSGNQMTFNFSNLKPYQNTATEIIFTINTPTNPTNPVNLGNLLNFSATVNPVSGDINPQDNVFTYQQTAVNSFDPNDIICMEGNSIPTSLVGQYLHYIVNFENIGTAPATNVVVEMDIDPTDFDINTLQLQNSSHKVYTRIKGNKVEFVMELANLGNGGHGNILMKMASKNNLVSGDNVMNKANIYFDYNFPIITNNEVTNIETVLQTTEVKKDDAIKLYPIPTKGDVTIEADSKIKSIEVYDASGRIIQKQISDSKNTKITIHSNSSGVFFFKINTEKGSLVKKVTKN